MEDKPRSNNSRDLSLKVLAHLNKLKIPTTPDNYNIWHTYFSGSNEALNTYLDQILNEKKPFTEDINHYIHSRFFEEHAQLILDELREALSQIIDKTGDELGNIDREINQFDSSLKSSKNQLEGEANGMLQQHIFRLIRDASNMLKATHDSSQSIAQLANEVKSLRAKVAELTLEASTDALTGIANRRVFDASYNELMKEAQYRGYSFSILMIDLDHFKNFNDEHGHTIGDMVLRYVATILNKITKGQDVAARYGGEEFAILLPDTNLQGGLVLAEKILQTVSKSELRVGRQKRNVGKITVSIGAAEFKEGDEDEALIIRADKCLYQAKKEGRNRAIHEHLLNKN